MLEVTTTATACRSLLVRKTGAVDAQVEPCSEERLANLLRVPPAGDTGKISCPPRFRAPDQDSKKGSNKGPLDMG